jgi:hypothetical protein
MSKTESSSIIFFYDVHTYIHTYVTANKPYVTVATALKALVVHKQTIGFYGLWKLLLVDEENSHEKPFCSPRQANGIPLCKQKAA